VYCQPYRAWTLQTGSQATLGAGSLAIRSLSGGLDAIQALPLNSCVAARAQEVVLGMEEMGLLADALRQLDEPFLVVVVGEFNSGKSTARARARARPRAPWRRPLRGVGWGGPPAAGAAAAKRPSLQGPGIAAAGRCALRRSL